LKRIRLPYSDLSQSSKGRDMSGEVPTVAGVRSDPVIGLSERTDALVRGLVFLLEHHSAEKRVITALAEQLHDYLDTSSGEGVWLKRAKYVLTYPCAKFLRNELPPSPDVVFRPSGPLRRWMKARMNAFNRKNVHLWYSWLQAKRCALSVSDTMIREAYEKHFKQLTQRDPCLDPTSEGVFWLEYIFDNPVFRNVLSHVSERVEQLYRGAFVDKTPSTSACFEATRSNGGQYGGLVALADIWNRSEADQPHGVHYILSERPPWIGVDELRRMVVRRVISRYGDLSFQVTEIRETCGRSWWNVLNRVSNSRLLVVPANLNATIQVVLEPLKMRIISKGPAYEYYQMKPLQQAIHGALREMPCFRLLGRPMCPTDLMDLVPHEIRPQDRWLSVDYSAATDGLSSEYGMRILHSILRRIDCEDVVRAAKVLGPHNLNYPVYENGKWCAKVESKGLQTNGQLMGGILSFPILCLANLGVYLAIRQICSADGDGSDHSVLGKVLVNGDDMLYVGDQVDWETHQRIGKSVGLEMSPGKAYIHRRYANANSTCFVYDLDRAETPYQINFLNVGLIFGQHKVQVRSAGTAESHHVQSGCVSNIPQMLAGSLPGRQSDILRYVLLKRRKEVREDSLLLVKQGRRSYAVARNLFLPICFGGMGIDAPVDWKYVVKKIDRRIAGSMRQNKGIGSSSPFMGFPVESSSESPPPWVAKNTESTLPELTLCQGEKLRHVPVVPHEIVWYSRGVYLE